MKYTTLGHTGIKVSRLSLGCMTYGKSSWQPWVLDEADSTPVLRHAWESGINFFDTADAYSRGTSEEILGKALKEFGVAREDVVISSKVFFQIRDGLNSQGLSRKHIRHAVEASLKRLKVEYIDLYQIHRFDYNTPIEETMIVLDQLVKEGKVLHIGASSMYTWEFMKMQQVADDLGLTRFVTMQNHYNLAYREEEREMIPYCMDQGIGILPWSPFAKGLLAGNRKSNSLRSKTDSYANAMFNMDADNEVADAVERVANERAVPNAQIALAWLLHQPAVTAPIIGARSEKHLNDAIAALDIEISEEEISILEAPYVPHRVLGHSYDSPSGIKNKS